MQTCFSYLFVCSVISALPLQQAQHIFLRRVGLGQHRGRRLLQDLVFGKICGFQCKVCVLDPASGSRQVGRDVGQIVESVRQTVGDRTLFRSLVIYLSDSKVNIN
jgi:hypothetical protein